MGGGAHVPRKGAEERKNGEGQGRETDGSGTTEKIALASFSVLLSVSSSTSVPCPKDHLADHRNEYSSSLSPL